MKILRGIKAIIILVIAPIVPTSAAYAQTYFASDTTVTCETYLHTKDSDPEISGAYDLWAFGYMSGLNVSNYHLKKVDLLSNHTRPDILRFIKTYCSVESASKKTLKEVVDKYWDTLSSPKQDE